MNRRHGRRPSRHALTAAVAAVLLAQGAQADDPPLARELDSVQVTANRRAEALSRAPRAVTVARADPDKALGRHTVAEQLRGLPGVFVQQTTPGQANAIVRGLKGSEVLHLVDGARMNTALFRNAPNNYIGLIDPLALERIEVVRGPTSVLYGSDAMGGVVHVLTEGLDLDAGAGETHRIQGGFASADLSTILRASSAIVGEHSGVRLALFRQDVDQRRTGSGDRLPFSAFTASGGELVAAYRTERWHTQLRASRYLQPSTPRHDALVAGFGQERPENAVFAFEPNRRDAASIRMESEGDGSFWDRAELVLGWQQVIDGRRTRDLDSEVTVLEDNASRMLSLSALFSRSLGGDSLLSFGADSYVDRVDSTRLARTPDGTSTMRAPRFANGARIRALGLFANHEWFPHERVELVSGLRYSRFDIELPGAGESPAASLEPDDLTGAVGLSVLVSPRLQLLANLGRGFRAPNVFDLGNLGPRPGGRYNLPNPGLAPEQVVTVDLGLRFGDHRTRAEVFVFASRYRDRIVSVETGDLRPDGSVVVQNRNIASARFRGLEAGFEHALGEDTLVHGSLNYTWGENRLPEFTEPADRIPPLNGTLGLRQRLGPTWTLDLRAWAADHQRRLSASDRSDPRIDPRGTPGFAAYGASLTRQIGERGHVVLRIENLLDRRYREHGSGMDAAGLDFSLAFDLRF